MSDPFSGLVPIAEFGSKFEADSAVALLESNGVLATNSHDPAMTSPVPHWATDRTFAVLVRAEDTDQAMALMRTARAGLPPEFSDEWQPTRTKALRARTRRWFIAATSATLGMVAVALLLHAIA